MPFDITFACNCGAVKGTVGRISPRAVTRLTCSCKHCRAFAKHLGADGPDVGDTGPVELLLVQPWTITFLAGKENLACLRLTPKGPLRWYAACCDTPLCNTFGRRFPPYVTLLTAIMGQDRGTLPKVSFHAFCDHLPEALRPRLSGAAAQRRFILRYLRRLVWGIPFQYRQTPFFDTAGRPVSTPELLTSQQMKAAYET